MVYLRLRLYAIHHEGFDKSMQATRIKTILKTILNEHSQHCVDGEPSLEFLTKLSTIEVKNELRKFKGVGPKVNITSTTF